MPSRPPYDPYVIGNLIVSQHIWRLYGTPDASHDSHLPATIIVTPSNVVKGIIGNMDVPSTSLSILIGLPDLLYQHPYPMSSKVKSKESASSGLGLQALLP
jgi:hypothetical protein